MGKRTPNEVPSILLIDDHPITPHLILRLFHYLGYPVKHIDQTAEAVELNKTEQFDLILINLAVFCLETYWVSRGADFLNENTPIVFYTPDLLINDFKKAAFGSRLSSVEASWMVHSEFFQFLKEWALK